jgi:heme/copper-type cytochrome/quinol oxidase subunit 3
VSELAQQTTDYGIVEGEPPEQVGRNLDSAGHLLASASAFFFLGFVFAYFYLRSLNSDGLWHPQGVDPSQTLGALVMVASVVTAVLLRWGLADHRADRRPAWRVKGAIALAFGLAAVVLQVVEWTQIGFGPTAGGYASVYFGWTGFYVVFLVGALYWLETVLATSIRYRGWATGQRTVAPGEASADPGRTGEDIRNPVSLVRAGLEALSFYWIFLAGIGVLTWIILYLA